MNIHSVAIIPDKFVKDDSLVSEAIARVTSPTTSQPSTYHDDSSMLGESMRDESLVGTTIAQATIPTTS